MSDSTDTAFYPDAERRKVEVIPYNASWVEAFFGEAARLKAALGMVVKRIYHIGSTAIPGMPAKPIIDIMIEATDLLEVDRKQGALVALGYTSRGEYGIPGRRFFLKGIEHRTHHVHVFASGHSDIARHLEFRNYLIDHPEDAEAYGALKVKLARVYPDRPHAYNQAKSDFIGQINNKAALSKKVG